MSVLNFLHFSITIIDGFGSPGDTLLTSIIISNLKNKYPNLKVNIITKNTDLIRNDPVIDYFNRPETFFSENSWYLDIINNKDGNNNVLTECLMKLGIKDLVYSCTVHLEPKELLWAQNKIFIKNKVIIGFNTRSKQPVKNWPTIYWGKLIARFPNAEWIQLGDHTEPYFKIVKRYAGKLSKRESMAILSQCNLFIGPDSFLAHAANGLNKKSIIIFGGSRSSKNLGYKKNINLENQPVCSPCWIHQENNPPCPFDHECLSKISVEEVEYHINEIISNFIS